MEKSHRNNRKVHEQELFLDTSRALFLWCTGMSVRRIARNLRCSASRLHDLKREMDREVI